MQRILSLETSRSPNTSSEFVSKRLCFSILFSIAFLFLIAGYLLGRYTTDRAILLRQAYVRQKLFDEKIDNLKNISESLKKINLIHLQPSQNITFIYEEWNNCVKSKNELPEIKEDANVMISKVLRTHLENLSNCYNTVENLLRSIAAKQNQ
nr:uncharacterized protein LOC111416643 [Onthophagus taurus]